MVYFQLDGLSRVLNDYASEIQNVNYLSNDRLEEKLESPWKCYKLMLFTLKLLKII